MRSILIAMPIREILGRELRFAMGQAIYLPRDLPREPLHSYDLSCATRKFYSSHFFQCLCEAWIFLIFLTKASIEMLGTVGHRLPELRRTMCLRCARLPAVRLRQNQSRGISQKVLAKRSHGEEEWALRARAIENGEIPNLWDTFEDRGYIKDIAGWVGII